MHGIFWTSAIALVLIFSAHSNDGIAVDKKHLSCLKNIIIQPERRQSGGVWKRNQQVELTRCKKWRDINKNFQIHEDDMTLDYQFKHPAIVRSISVFMLNSMMDRVSSIDVQIYFANKTDQLFKRRKIAINDARHYAYLIRMQWRSLCPSKTVPGEPGVREIVLKRCCRMCCQDSFLPWGIGDHAMITFNIKRGHMRKLFVNKVIMFGQIAPRKEARNLVIHKPVQLELTHGKDCKRAPSIANDEQVRPDQFLHLDRKPYLWGVDLGANTQVGLLWITFKGDWVDTKIVLRPDNGPFSQPYYVTKCLQSKAGSKTSLCCDIFGQKARWMQIKSDFPIQMRLMEARAYSENDPKDPKSKTFCYGGKSVYMGF